ncbi:MAG: prepilin-type N-terminal cleavage/methylation domain-containing protein, partial [Phycisphaerae bacterium]|nr:prepilin-type N-terminal cleavage/methylation domain-containing protein [Phycisphaerae bacterium]
RDFPLLLSLAFQQVTTMKSKERGVTLQEMIISLAVVGVVAAVGIP